MAVNIVQDLILGEQATLGEALRLIDDTAIGIVLICADTDRLVGLISEGDIRRALLNGSGLASPVMPFVNKSPRTGKLGMTREDLVSLLSDKIHSLPILNAEGRVVDLLLHDKRTAIPVATPAIGERELSYVSDAVLSGWVSSQGKYIGIFEEKFSQFCGAKHCVVLMNGTVALHLSLVALGIGPGDEVIVPALTFVAPASATKHCGAEPIFVDVEIDSWNLDPDKIELAITERTKAIIPVHLYGNPCRMDRIMEIAEKHKLYVIEDAAEAHGAEFNGARVGSLGHMATFSFYGNKIITSGEGGAIVCNDPELDQKIRILRDHGMSPERRYWHDSVGFNYRMTNLQAALGVAQLERWEGLIGAKERIREYYDTSIRVPGVRRAKSPITGRSVNWLYTSIVDPTLSGFSRDQLIDKLKTAGVDSRPIFYVVPAMPPYYVDGWRERFPNATFISENGFSLPSSVELSDLDLERISSAVISAWRQEELDESQDRLKGVVGYGAVKTL